MTHRRTTVCIKCRKVFRDVYTCPRCQKPTKACSYKIEVPSPKNKKIWDRFFDPKSPTYLQNKRR